MINRATTKEIRRRFFKSFCVLSAMGSLATGCNSIVRANQAGVVNCDNSSPLRTADTSFVGPVSELVAPAREGLKTLRERALHSPDRKINIATGVGRVTLRRDFSPEIQIINFNDVALTFPHGQSEVTISFPSYTNGDINLSPNILGCSEQGRTTPNQLASVIKSYVSIPQAQLPYAPNQG